VIYQQVCEDVTLSRRFNGNYYDFWAQFQHAESGWENEMPVTLGRREWLQRMAGGVAGLTLGRTPGMAQRTGRDRPNILFLFTDDQRFNTLNALNNPEVQTPTMDRLVRNGTAFTRAGIMGGTVGAVCAPSRAMLMTGQTLFHVDRSIVRPEQAQPNERLPFTMFPELLRRQGYETFGTGKWHNGEKLFARCFSSGDNIFFGGMSDHLKVPVADFDPTGEYPKAKQHIGGKFSSELFSDSAVSFLKKSPKDKPWLAYVAYTAPHDPRMAPKDYAAMYPASKIRLPENFLPQHPFDNGDMRLRDEQLAPWPRTPEVIREHIAAYYAMITHVDAQMGRVLKALEESGQSDNTIVVFASDNGLAVGQHGLLGKQNMYEHSVRVPLVIGGAGLPKGRRIDALCYLYDIFPTLCDLTSSQIPKTVEGASLEPVIRGKQTKVRDSMFFAYREFQRAVKTERWKLILYNVNGTKTTQLFDMQSDPLERRNLAAEPRHEARIRDLTALMKVWMKKTDDHVDLDKPDWGLQAPPAAAAPAKARRAPQAE
jgi:arylsulfatase A-like enzyme